MADDAILRFELIDWAPISRPMANEDKFYPWGDGYPPDSTLRGPDGNDPVNQPSPGGMPYKWPSVRDWRSPAFQPWSLANSVPQPAAWNATVKFGDGDIDWPAASDEGKRVLVYPQTDPSTPAENLIWFVPGLDGGDVEIFTSYVRSPEATADFPSGSLRTRARAVTRVKGEDGQLWQSDWSYFRPARNYTGRYEWFGPMLCEKLRFTGLLEETNCAGCISPTSVITLPDLGIGSDLPGGLHVAGINGATIRGSAIGSLCYFEGRSTKVITDEIGLPCQDDDSEATWQATLQLVPGVPLNTVVLQLSYRASRDIADPSSGCVGAEIPCCSLMGDIYGDPFFNSNGQTGNTAQYVAEGGFVGCQGWEDFMNRAVFSRTSGNDGNNWAGDFPETVQLTLGIV